MRTFKFYKTEVGRWYVDLPEWEGRSWELGEGAWYKMIGYMGLDYELTMWLCDVTKFVFDEFPKNIYFQKVND